MRQIVIDTNVIISSVLSPNGKPSEIVKRCFSNSLQLICTNEILDEYRRVLSYNKLNITADTQASIIRAIEEVAVFIEPTVSEIPLPHESDRIFYDTAKSGNAILITGNLKHFPDEPFIMTPSDLMQKEDF